MIAEQLAVETHARVRRLPYGLSDDPEGKGRQTVHNTDSLKA
jgi:hypothetical protein